MICPFGWRRGNETPTSAPNPPTWSFDWLSGRVVRVLVGMFFVDCHPTLRTKCTLKGFKVHIPYSHPTWRVGGLSNCLFLGLISTITPIRVPFRVLISLLTTYLLSPLKTLQVRVPTLRMHTARRSEAWAFHYGLLDLKGTLIYP